MGPARRADSLSAPAGLETALGRLEIAPGGVPRPGEVAAGFLGDGGDRDPGASAGARQAGQWQGVSAGGCGMIPPFFGDQRGGPAPLRGTYTPAPMQPPVPSCHLTLSVGVCTGSLFQPGTHGCFLMHPAPWTATEKAA